MLPPVYRSNADLAERRAQCLANLDRLLAAPRRLADPLRDVAALPFYLAYQGHDDAPTQAKLATLFGRASPPLPVGPARALPAAGPRRIGLFSSWWHGHSIGSCYLRTAGTLAEAGLAVTVLDGRPAPGGLERMPQGVEYRPLPRNLAAATAALAEAALDVLLFTDMGMDTFAYFLALGRHAPVQCVLNGHPITTGLPEIDYFISFRAVGGAGFEERYTERLMLLDWYPGIFARPPVPPAPLGRAALGLPVEGRLYVCPMTLYKIHPDFDSALAGILASDQEARVVLFRDRHAASLHEVLAGRFRDTLGADAGRVIFLPYATPEAFMSVMMHAAAVLDSFPFGGTTTSLIALASGTPVVTRLGTLARGRFTAGYYRAIGVEDCIAHSLDAYVALAVRLGTEPDFRAAVSARIRDRVAVLYDNPAGARALADFLASLAPRAAA